MNTDHTKRNLFELYAELIHQQEKWEGLIKAFLSDELRKLDVEHGSKSQLTMTEIHVLSCVGDNEPINVTSIAEKMNTTKATVSRISTKLLGAGFLHRTQLSDNKKEVYFRLTPAGKSCTVCTNIIIRRLNSVFCHFLTAIPRKRFFCGTAVSGSGDKMVSVVRRN